MITNPAGNRRPLFFARGAAYYSMSTIRQLRDANGILKALGADAIRDENKVPAGLIEMSNGTRLLASLTLAIC